MSVSCLRIVTLLVAVSLAWMAPAQEARSTLHGHVSDSAGARVAGASVTVVNLATNQTQTLQTNQTGYYEVPFLNSGSYRVSVELTGFKKTVQSPVELTIGASVEVNLTLEVGSVSESITVTSEAPALETATASAGRVIPARQIRDLPIAWMNPMLLMQMAPGMVARGVPSNNLPWQTGPVSNVRTMGNGAIAANQITVDGAVINGRDQAVGYIPNLDSVAEFKMELVNFDASTGHSSGAFVNMSTKSGTNQLHGSLFEQHWQQRWNATPHFTRLSWENSVATGAIRPDSPKQPSGRSNQFGGSVGGPITIPKLVDGRNRAFFFFSYSGIQQRLSATGNNLNVTVPSAAWRQGDFSDLLAVDSTAYQIYDPRSARTVNGRVVRTPFPGNRGIPVLNPMYSFYSRLYPQPNNVAGIVDNTGRNNYYAVAEPNNNSYNNLLNRFDFNLSSNHRLSGKWYWSHYRADAGDWTFETMRGLQSSGTTQYSKGFSSDYTWSMGAHSVFSLSISATQFADGNENTVNTQFKASDVGLPAYLDAYAGDLHQLPRLNFSTIQSVGSAYPGINSRASTGQMRAGLVRVSGAHTWKFGWEERRYWRALRSPATTSGQFTFGRDFVRSADNDTRASNTGLEWAAFMMAVPTTTGTSGVEYNDSGYFSTPWRSFYAQDEIRLGTRTHLTVGARLEWEHGSTERFNRGQSGGFDFSLPLPFSAAVEAAYAKSPLPNLPASQFKVQGGGFYLGQNSPRTLTEAQYSFLPRVGFVHQINSKTVLRAGTGWYADSLNVNQTTMNQFGYSVNTSTTVSNDNGMTFCCDASNQFFDISRLTAQLNPMTNPFPVRADGSRFDMPYGNSLGAVAYSGKNVSFLARDFKAGRQQRWRVGLQRELRRNLVAEVSYNGSWTVRPLGINGNSSPVNYLPSSYYSSAQVRNTAVDSDLNTRVPNPFLYTNFSALAQSDPRLYSYLRTQSFFTATTITKGQLLLPYPLFGSIDGRRPGDKTKGYSQYRDLQVQVEQRFSRGLTTSVMYTRSASSDKYTYMNPFDIEPVWEDNGDARPHIFLWTGTWELPFGKGSRSGARGLANRLAAGWQVGWTYQYQSGISLIFTGLPNAPLFYYGDLSKLAGRLNHEGVNAKDIHLWFDPTATYRNNVSTPIPQDFVGFEGRNAFQPAYNVNTWPTTRFGDVRGDALRLWNATLKREFRITENVKARFGIDLLNLTNHTNFGNPNITPTNSNFGRVTSQNGAGRMIQAAFRMQF